MSKETLVLRAELDGEVEVFLYVTDLTAFIQAPRDALVAVYDADGNGNQVRKGSLSGFRIHTV